MLQPRGVPRCPKAEPHGWNCFSQELNEELMFAKPNIYCHFAQGMDESKYMPVTSWPALSRLLEEALDSYNEVNAVMNLVSVCGRQLHSEMGLWHCTAGWGWCIMGHSLLFLP